MNENLDILIKNAESQAQSLRGHAQELNAAASTQELLIGALKDLRQQKEGLIKENQELKKNRVIHIDQLHGNYFEKIENISCQLPSTPSMGTTSNTLIPSSTDPRPVIQPLEAH